MDDRTAQIRQIGLEQLRLSPHAPQGVDLSPSHTLLERLRTCGVVEPLVVRSNDTGQQHYEILSHPQVWVGAGRLGMTKLPVWSRSDITDDEAARIVRLHYGGLLRDPIAEAEAFAELLSEMKNSGWGSVSRLAKNIGYERSYVAHALRLLELPTDLQEKVRAGQLRVGHARVLVSLEPSMQQQLAKAIVGEQLSIRETERRAHALRGGQPTTTNAKVKDPDVERLEAQMTTLIGSPFSLNNGKISVDYFDDLDVLQGLLLRLGYEPE